MKVKKLLSKYINGFCILLVCVVLITNSHQARTEVTDTIKNSALNDKVIKSIDANNSENLFSNYLRALHAEKIVTFYLLQNFTLNLWQ